MRRGYEYLEIHDEAALIANLRRQLEGLNDYAFSDSEWTRFFRDCIAGANDGIWKDAPDSARSCAGAAAGQRRVQKHLPAGQKHIHNNRLQVLHQYEGDCGQSRHALRCDRPRQRPAAVVHIELKRRGVAIREAFNQIKRYQRDSFLGSKRPV